VIAKCDWFAALHESGIDPQATLAAKFVVMQSAAFPGMAW